MLRKGRITERNEEVKVMSAIGSGNWLVPPAQD